MDAIAGKVWHAAPFLVDTLDMAQLEGKKILELGAGTVFVGISVESHVKSGTVVITDIAKAIPLIKNNITLNEALYERNEVRVMARELDWFRPPESRIVDEFGQFDVILISDCVYWVHLHDPLLTTLLYLCPVGTKTVIYLSYRLRSMTKEYDFFDKLGRYFSIEVVRETDPAQEDQITVLECRRRKLEETGIESAAVDETWTLLRLGRINMDVFE